MDFYVRPIGAGDAKAVNEMRRMPGVFENMLGVPSERVSRSEEFIQHLDANEHQFVAAAAADGVEKVIGTAGLRVSANPRLSHSASIGIMVHRDYQGMGVGTRLMETLLDMADNWLMLVRVELGVYTDNAKAIALYKKMGFEEEGVKRKAAIRNGRYVDEMIMARIRNV